MNKTVTSCKIKRFSSGKLRVKFDIQDFSHKQNITHIDSLILVTSERQEGQYALWSIYVKNPVFAGKREARRCPS